MKEVAYCKYHEIKLTPLDITQRKCKARNCNYLRTLDNRKKIRDVEYIRKKKRVQNNWRDKRQGQTKNKFLFKKNIHTDYYKEV